MKVDDICNAISRSKDPRHIKLVLIRYIGPFRPSTEALVSHDVPKKIENTTGCKDRTLSTSSDKKPMKKKGGFRLFGRGKKNNTKNEMS